MSDEPIMTGPPVEGDNHLQQKYYESVAGQSELMDQLGRQLITLELGIPGLYAAVFKFFQGDKPAQATSGPVSVWLIAAFACWFLALTLTLFSLIPQKWKVDPNVIRRDSGVQADSLSLEEFFSQSATYKRELLIPSCLLFLAGIACSVLGSF